MPTSGFGGPCNHCGSKHSCCWRRGPLEKPVLCNACGSRYLVKKSLEGYIPIQKRNRNAFAQTGMRRSGSQVETSSTSVGAISGAPSGVGMRRSRRANAMASNGGKEEELLRQGVKRPGPEIVKIEEDKDGEDGEEHQQHSLSLEADVLVHSSHKEEAHMSYVDTSGDVHRSDEDMLGTSLRLKPRKRPNPTISVVF